MKPNEAMQRLKAAGTAQNRKIYTRHGVTGEQFGVSYGELGKLRKAIGTDDELAEALWSTGNHDARILATQIADPDAATRKRLDGWIRDIDNYVTADAFSAYVARTKHALACAEKWTKSKTEWIAAVGWNLVTQCLAQARAEAGLDKETLEAKLATIEGSIHNAANRARYAMNGALIAIGTYARGFEKKAIAAAKRIGPVDVDHGETGCRTPDAVKYIPKAAAHHRERLAKKKTAKKATRKKAPRARS